MYSLFRHCLLKLSWSFSQFELILIKQTRCTGWSEHSIVMNANLYVLQLMGSTAMHWSGNEVSICSRLPLKHQDIKSNYCIGLKTSRHKYGNSPGIKYIYKFELETLQERYKLTIRKTPDKNTLIKELLLNHTDDNCYECRNISFWEIISPFMHNVSKSRLQMWKMCI